MKTGFDLLKDMVTVMAHWRCDGMNIVLDRCRYSQQRHNDFTILGFLNVERGYLEKLLAFISVQKLCF